MIFRSLVVVEAEAPWCKGFRYPAEVISHCVWLYHRFPLSFLEVEELLLARGVVVSYETVRQWCAKFGPEYAARLRRRSLVIAGRTLGVEQPRERALHRPVTLHVWMIWTMSGRR